MVGLPTKIVTFRHATVVCSVAQYGAEFPAGRSLLKPIRTTRDGILGVPYDDRLYPLFLDAKADFCILKEGASYSLKDAKIPSIPLSAKLSFAVLPLELELDSEFSWKVERDEFGVFVFLTAADTLVELLITYLVENNGLRILSWGESHESGHDWFIRLSAGLSIDTVQKSIASVAEDLDKIIQSDKDEKSKKQFESLQRDLEKTRTSFSSELKTKNAELGSVYSELSNAIDTVDELKALLEDHGDSNNGASGAVGKLRRGSAEKALARVIYSCFPNLALPPDTTTTIIERFTESESVWEVLLKLNEGTEVPLERLKGLAGKAGWFEVRLHINTGLDKRGRVYCRKSTKKQALDAIVHWKKDKKDQERLFARLASYPPFSGREGVLR